MDVLKEELFPLADLLTPNIPETEVLTGRKIKSADDMIEAAKQVSEQYHCAVSAVMALMAYTPFAIMVLISAWIPAPPLESLPAMVNAVFIFGFRAVSLCSSLQGWT